MSIQGVATERGYKISKFLLQGRGTENSSISSACTRLELAATHQKVNICAIHCLRDPWPAAIKGGGAGCEEDQNTADIGS
jgi:hypothetical protein